MELIDLDAGDGKAHRQVQLRGCRSFEAETVIRRPAHAEVEVEIEAVAGKHRGDERIGALGSQCGMTAGHLETEAWRELSVEDFDAAGEGHRIELDDPAAGKLEERLRLSGWRRELHPRDRLAGRAVHDAARTEQP